MILLKIDATEHNKGNENFPMSSSTFYLFSHFCTFGLGILFPVIIILWGLKSDCVT